MTNQTSPYISRNPGDLLSAGDWNQMQLDIKTDILANKEAAKEEIREEGVDMAGNSEKFDNKTGTQWVAQLDERYAQKVHDHEETAGYRRYIKRFTSGEEDIALLDHNLGRYPLADLYQLMEVVGLTNDRKILEECPDLETCKLFVYYGHREAERYGLMGSIHRRKIKIGIPLEQFLTELAVQYEDDDTLGDVLNDMLDAFMEDPNDEITHCRSAWIEDSVKERRTVQDLKVADEWNDIKVALAPQQVRGDVLSYQLTIEIPSGANEAPQRYDVTVNHRVNVLHANYDTTAVFIENADIVLPPGAPGDLELERRARDMLKPVDIMTLLRS
jgi:hypothetical protein